MDSNPTASSPSKRQVRPSAKLGSDNGGEHQLASHRAAIQDALEKDARKANSETTTSSNVQPSVPPVHQCGDAQDRDDAIDSVGTPKAGRKRKVVVLSDVDESDDDDKTSSSSTPKAKKKKKKAVKKKKVTDNPGGATIQTIDLDTTDSATPGTLNATHRTADLAHFFVKAPHKPGHKR